MKKLWFLLLFEKFLKLKLLENMKKRLKNIVSPYFSGLETIFSDTK